MASYSPAHSSALCCQVRCYCLAPPCYCLAPPCYCLSPPCYCLAPPCYCLALPCWHPCGVMGCQMHCPVAPSALRNVTLCAVMHPHVHRPVVPLDLPPLCCPPCAGDGWSSRMEDALLHGCIPVIVMDQVGCVGEMQGLAVYPEPKI